MSFRVRMPIAPPASLALLPAGGPACIEWAGNVNMASLASTGSTSARERIRDRALIRAWLVLVAAMIVAMVVVGGATRLTHSGLSITEWQPIHGVVPPLNDAEWQEEFAKYRQIPEFRLINPDMTLAQFKGIFWWEWAHRLLGRLIGVVVLVPLIGLWMGGRIESALKPKLIAIFLLGGLQGAVGWWMVASGLVERTDVSQYRLATHLTLACAILAYVVWVAQGLRPARTEPAPAAVRRVAALMVALAFVQIFLGGLVAGLDAGLTLNTWPLMDGSLVPSGLLAQSPAWVNVFENVTTVQFDHRLGAYLLFALALGHAFQVRNTGLAGSAWLVAALVTVQAGVGIATLVSVVPLPLALLHQFGAVAVLIAAVTHLRAASLTKSVDAMAIV
jgi:cytochrome c oxidase assembly protein subunit 15